MEFNEKTHKVKIETMDSWELADYITFLQIEKYRHMNDIKQCQMYLRLTPREPLRKFFDSAIRRHEEDIKSIDELCIKLRRKK